MSLSSARKQQWQSILEMTQRMQQLSTRQEPWSDVLEIQEQRQAMLNSFFASPVDPGEAEQIAQGIRVIMESDQVLLGLGKQVRDELGQSLGRLSTNRKAIGAYDSCK